MSLKERATRIHKKDTLNQVKNDIINSKPLINKPIEVNSTNIKQKNSTTKVDFIKGVNKEDLILMERNKINSLLIEASNELNKEKLFDGIENKQEKEGVFKEIEYKIKKAIIQITGIKKKNILTFGEVNKKIHNILFEEKLCNKLIENELIKSKFEEIKKENEIKEKLENEIDLVLSKANQVLNTFSSNNNKINKISSCISIESTKKEVNFVNTKKETQASKALYDNKNKISILFDENLKNEYFLSLANRKSLIAEYRGKVNDLKAKTYHISKMFSTHIELKKNIKHVSTDNNCQTQFGLSYIYLYFFPLFQSLKFKLESSFINYKIEEAFILWYMIKKFFQINNIETNFSKESLTHYNKYNNIKAYTNLLVDEIKEWICFLNRKNKIEVLIDKQNILSIYDNFDNLLNTSLYQIYHNSLKCANDLEILISPLLKKQISFDILCFLRNIHCLIFNKGSFLYQIVKYSKERTNKSKIITIGK